MTSTSSQRIFSQVTLIPISLFIAVSLVVIPSLLSGKPPTTVDPYVDEFTLKITHWAYERINSSQFKQPHGIRYPNISCSIAFVVQPGDKLRFHCIGKGSYRVGKEISETINVSSNEKGNEWPYFTENTLKDIFGADAISDVRFLDMGAVHEKEKSAVIDALQKSGGDTIQASDRLHITEKDLLKKMEEYGMPITKGRSDMLKKSDGK